MEQRPQVTEPDPLAPDLIVAAMNERLLATLDRLKELRSRPVTPEVVDELTSIQFRGSRLSRRLRVLGHQGLLTLSARSLREPAELLRAAVGEVEEDCEARGIEIAVEADDGLPALWLDPEQVVESLRCILDNAIEAIGRDGKIVARASGTNGDVVLSVGNDGPPFAPEILPRAFAAGVSSRREGPGEGLGLTIVRRIADGLGGDARIETDQEWTEISLSIPRTLARRLREDAEPDARPSRTWVFPVPRAA
ncbi:MAG: ATP-binding protein [Deltaproteobacteria bacterium]|nr:ATP-binding protein [Deltaproteobacteria bacterium]